MRKTILTAQTFSKVIGATLVAVSLAQTAAAADRHHARRAEQFRNANNAVVVQPSNGPQNYSGGYSAPAGR